MFYHITAILQVISNSKIGFQKNLSRTIGSIVQAHCINSKVASHETWSLGSFCQANKTHFHKNTCIILTSPLHLLVYKVFTRIHPSPSFVYSITKIVYHCIHRESPSVYHIGEVGPFCYPELKKENIINIKSALLILSQIGNIGSLNILLLPV